MGKKKGKRKQRKPKYGLGDKVILPGKISAINICPDGIYYEIELPDRTIETYGETDIR